MDKKLELVTRDSDVHNYYLIPPSLDKSTLE